MKIEPVKDKCAQIKKNNSKIEKQYIENNELRMEKRE